MTTDQARRLARLEAHTQTAGCATCHAWPRLIITIAPDPEPPAVCPVCGRVASQIVRLDCREDGPQ